MPITVTLSSDIFNTGSDGFDFLPGQQKLTILTNVVVHSDSLSGVYSNHPIVFSK